MFLENYNDVCVLKECLGSVITQHHEKTLDMCKKCVCVYETDLESWVEFGCWIRTTTSNNVQKFAFHFAFDHVCVSKAKNFILPEVFKPKLKITIRHYETIDLGLQRSKTKCNSCKVSVFATKEYNYEPGKVMACPRKY